MKAHRRDKGPGETRSLRKLNDQMRKWRPLSRWIKKLDMQFDDEEVKAGFVNLCRKVAVDERFSLGRGYASIWYNNQEVELFERALVGRCYSAFENEEMHSSVSDIFRASRKFNLDPPDKQAADPEELLYGMKLSEDAWYEAWALFRGIGLTFGYATTVIGNASEVCDPALPKACGEMARELMTNKRMRRKRMQRDRPPWESSDDGLRR